MQLFFDPDIREPQHILREEESKHAARVLRLAAGDTLHVVNGQGDLFICELLEAHQKHCALKVLEKKSGLGHLKQALHIAVAPTKSNDRFEWFLEKSTEIGISEITPIICEHSERKLVKQERMTRVIVAAMKQSLKAWIPKLNDQSKFKEFVTSAAIREFNGQKFIAHCEGDKRIELHEALKKGEASLILIGPEGDFSPNEVELAQREGFSPITFGNNRLRTETAAIVACHTVNLLNEIK